MVGQTHLQLGGFFPRNESSHCRHLDDRAGRDGIPSHAGIEFDEEFWTRVVMLRGEFQRARIVQGGLLRLAQPRVGHGLEWGQLFLGEGVRGEGRGGQQERLARAFVEFPCLPQPFVALEGSQRRDGLQTAQAVNRAAGKATSGKLHLRLQPVVDRLSCRVGGFGGTGRRRLGFSRGSGTFTFFRLGRRILGTVGLGRWRLGPDRLKQTNCQKQQGKHTTQSWQWHC